MNPASGAELFLHDRPGNGDAHNRCGRFALHSGIIQNNPNPITTQGFKAGKTMASPPDEVTQLLLAWTDGDESALTRLVPLVETELHRLAQAYLHRERFD